MPSDKYAIEQTIRSFFAMMGLPYAEFTVQKFEELENFDFVEFSYNHFGLRAMVFLQGEYHDQPGYLFLDSSSMLIFMNSRIYEAMEKHKKDYPHGIGM